MLNTFRFISLLEGISFLTILSVTLGLISRDYVYNIGMLHGILFMLYLIMSLIVSGKEGWPLKIWLPLFFAAFIPFAFIPVEMYLKKASLSKAQEQVM